MNVMLPNETSVFVVTGGGKGITAQCAIKLAQRYGSEFVLLGRSSIAEPEPAWAAGCNDEVSLKQCAISAMRNAGQHPKPADVQRAASRVLAQREIADTLHAIEAAGGTATYLSADVTDREALRTALAPVSARVTGIIHGAGVLADKRIEKKTGADFDLVYGIKVRGLKNLLGCVPPSQLRHLVLFSSVAGFYGNVGQADYALANEVLNKLAHRLQRDYPACHVVAVDWGPWDGGMVTSELKQLFAERNIAIIPVDVGTDLLADELALGAGTPQIIVGGTLTSPKPEPMSHRVDLRHYRLHRALTLDANPFLRDHVIGGHAVLPTVCAIGWMVNACENLYPGYAFARVEDYRALKGIVFDDTLADDYILNIQEIVQSSDEILFECLIESKAANGKPRYHYKATIALRPEERICESANLRVNESANYELRVASNQRAPNHPIAQSPGHAIPGTALYNDNTLFHGPSFRGVEEVWNITERGLTMRCRLPEAPAEVYGQFPVQTFNPYLADAQLQSLLVWAKQMRGVVGLPLRIGKGEQFHQPRFGEVTYASLTIQSAGDHSLVADVVVYNEAGDIYSRVTGAEITLSARLNALFEQGQLGESRW